MKRVVERFVECVKRCSEHDLFIIGLLLEPSGELVRVSTSLDGSFAFRFEQEEFTLTSPEEVRNALVHALLRAKDFRIASIHAIAWNEVGTVMWDRYERLRV